MLYKVHSPVRVQSSVINGTIENLSSSPTSLSDSEQVPSPWDWENVEGVL